MTVRFKTSQEGQLSEPVTAYAHRVFAPGTSDLEKEAWMVQNAARSWARDKIDAKRILPEDLIAVTDDGVEHRFSVGLVYEVIGLNLERRP